VDIVPQIERQRWPFRRRRDHDADFSRRPQQSRRSALDGETLGCGSSVGVEQHKSALWLKVCPRCTVGNRKLG
jgi:hypothetical protein